jgi:hypothetical protein
MNVLDRFGSRATKGIAHNTAKDQKPIDFHSRRIRGFGPRAATPTAVALSVLGTQIALGDTAQASTTNDTVMATSTSAPNRTVVATTPLLAATTRTATHHRKSVPMLTKILAPVLTTVLATGLVVAGGSAASAYPNSCFITGVGPGRTALGAGGDYQMAVRCVWNGWTWDTYGPWRSNWGKSQANCGIGTVTGQWINKR